MELRLLIVFIFNVFFSANSFPVTSTFYKQTSTSLVFKPSMMLLSKSTITTPPKVQPPKVNKPTKETKISNPDVIFKQNIDIAKEFEDYVDSESYVVILYNDPFNKRNYVATVLMDTFSWDETLANAVMLEAHNSGLAITGEYSKDTAFDYVKKLLDKGLFSEARKADDVNGGGDDATPSTPL